MCDYIVNEYLKQLPADCQLQVYQPNDYPCLLVKIGFIQAFEYVEDWNKLFISYYIAIVNKNAGKAKIPIELVKRSSFGHIVPSIDITGATFRINIGIIPEIYGNIIAQSLIDLYKIATQEINKELKHYTTTEGKNFIASMNVKIESYEKASLPKWEEHQKCYEILQLMGDSIGGHIIHQITRKRVSVDLLADYVAEELDKENPDFTMPIVRILDQLQIDKQVSLIIHQNSFKRNEGKWLTNENHKIKADNAFWEIIRLVTERLNAPKEIFIRRQLSDLYNKLEEANKEFIIRSVSTLEAQDGIGSDSEFEAKSLTGDVYARKILVSTGMMAINLAHYLARYYFKQYLGVHEYRADYENMYYQTGKALDFAANNKELAVYKKNNLCLTHTLLFFDLNHCDTLGNQYSYNYNRLKSYISTSLAEKTIPVVILDCTSSTLMQMKTTVNDAVSLNIKLILLVSSGLKNEQCGADNNPYGTVRIYTLDKAQRDDLYKKAQSVLNKTGLIPAISHKIRRGYKKAGFIPTNRKIFDIKTEDYDDQRDKICNEYLFIEAAKKGDVEQLTILLNSNVDINTVDFFERATALHWAIPNIEAMKFLLDKNINPNIRDKSGDTALHWAVRLERIEAINLLISYGAKIHQLDDYINRLNERDDYRQRYSIVQSRGYSQEIVEILRLNEESLRYPNQDIFEILITGNLNDIKSYVASGGNLNIQNEATGDSLFLTVLKEDDFNEEMEPLK